MNDVTTLETLPESLDSESTYLQFPGEDAWYVFPSEKLTDPEIVEFIKAKASQHLEAA